MSKTENYFLSDETETVLLNLLHQNSSNFSRPCKTFNKLVSRKVQISNKNHLHLIEDGISDVIENVTNANHDLHWLDSPLIHLQESCSHDSLSD